MTKRWRMRETGQGGPLNRNNSPGNLGAPLVAVAGLGALAIATALDTGSGAPERAVAVLGIGLGGTLAVLGLRLRHPWVALSGIVVLYVWYWPWLPAIGYHPIVHTAIRVWVLIPVAVLLVSLTAERILGVWGNVLVVLLGVSLLFDTGLVLLSFFAALGLGGDPFFIPWALLHYFLFPLLVAVLCFSLGLPPVRAYYRAARNPAT